MASGENSLTGLFQRANELREVQRETQIQIFPEVVLCRIRLFPTLILKMNLLGLPLILSLLSTHLLATLQPQKTITIVSIGH